MSRNEKRFLIGFAVLGIFTIMASMALTGALLVANMSHRSTTTVNTAAAQAPVLNQVIKDVTAPLTEAVKQPPAEPKEKAVPSAPESPRQALPLAKSPASELADLTVLYDQVNPGVVAIEVQSVAQSPFGQGTFRQSGQGSGFVYDDRHIVTNRHVVESADEVEIVFYNGERRAGKVIGTDEYADLAVVEVADMPADARKLPLVTDFGKLDVGIPVIAIGNPFGNANSMSYGIISALGRTIPANGMMGGFSIPQTIQTDAAINPGNSGGPLLDLQGEVIGVNAQINTTNVGRSGPPGNSGVGFAIPSSIVARVVPSLIEKGRYEWSYLGITGQKITIDLAKANKLASTHGAYVISVRPDGPSVGKLQGAANVTEQAPQPQQLQPNGGGGLQIPIQPQDPQEAVVPQGGDVITAIDGKAIGTFEDLLSYIALDTRPGQTVKLTVLRNGTAQDLEVQVKARPGNPAGAQQ